MTTPMELYRAEYLRHLEAGDDEMNAKLRIIEQGCDPAMADLIDSQEGDDDSELCDHEWQEQPGEPPVDVCSKCGAVRE